MFDEIVAGNLRHFDDKKYWYFHEMCTCPSNPEWVEELAASVLWFDQPEIKIYNGRCTHGKSF